MNVLAGFRDLFLRRDVHALLQQYPDHYAVLNAVVAEMVVLERQRAQAQEVALTFERLDEMKDWPA